jgi:hypothetical protein
LNPFPIVRETGKKQENYTHKTVKKKLKNILHESACRTADEAKGPALKERRKERR